MSTSALASDVSHGLDELEAAFPDRVTAEPDGTGGAFVSVDSIDLGDRWARSITPLAFHLPYNYPAGAIYPFYLPGDVTPNGGLPPALQPVEWRGRRMIQVSLRHTNWDAQRDNAVGAVMQTQAWLKRQ
jgi:hypothetical protein